MPLKRMSEFKREDFVYNSPDGDEFEITIVQTSDQKWVEVRKGEEKVQWDVEMLLDIADAVRSAMQTTPKKSKHKLKGPNVVDHRDRDKPKEKEKETEPETIAENIQREVDESMDNADLNVQPVESFSQAEMPSLKDEIEERKGKAIQVPPEKIIKKVSAGDLM